MIGNIFRGILLLFLVAIGALLYTLITHGVGAAMQLFGILCAVSFVGLIVGGILLRFVLKKFAVGLSKALGGLAGPTPRRIRLRSEERFEWKDRAGIDKATRAFQQLGFNTAGTYVIDELGGIKLRAFCHVDEAIYGILYEHEKLGVWCDLVTRINADQRWHRITCSNSTSPSLGVLDPMPDRQLIKAPGAEVPAMLERLRPERPSGQRWSVSSKEFPKVFEEAYADEMDWRNARGGPTEDEVRRVAAAGGKDVTPEILEKTREQLTSRALNQLDETLRDEYVKANHLSFDQALKLVFIHDKLRPSDLLERLPNNRGKTETESAPVITTSPRQTFAELNAMRPPESQFRLLGTFEGLVTADIYSIKVSA